MGASAESLSRRQQILRADPYYPHTAWRAVVTWLLYFFVFLGFAALLTLIVPDREFGWYYAAYTAVFATISTVIQFLGRKARVRMLENTDQISRPHETRGNPQIG
ncbi:hypothetical protein D9R02_01005 [Kocuria rhizophila]|uniref:hypothetical protein n=1 Tax=Kocuria rhizophila TaxID=72000 RepID=UPI000EF1B01C|nr:hypothetical protein [Kocuria rhizophila]RLP61187.1 hypothetical protein D9R02_01005 [Kocuria rhizophila]